jgi:hypothetical protein
MQGSEVVEHFLSRFLFLVIRYHEQLHCVGIKNLID